MKPICKIVENAFELEGAHLVRRQVFVIEQNVPEDIEWDEFEDIAQHMICILDDKVVGTGRLVMFGTKAKIERVAVLKSYRNQGIGTLITQFFIDESNKKKAETIYAHVQLSAKKFYEKLGFSGIGGIFLEADIEHVKMVLIES